MLESIFLRQLSRERQAVLAAELRASDFEERAQQAAAAGDVYRKIALRDATTVSWMVEAFQRVKRVQADLEALLDGSLPPSTKAAVEKAVVDLAAAQDTANGDMPDEKRRRLNEDARAGLSEDHAILMALAQRREGQRGE